MTSHLPSPPTHAAPRRLAPSLAALAAAGLLGACSMMAPSAPPPPPDNSPAVPTAVRVVAMRSDGIAGFFPFEGSSGSYTRADMQRDETSTKLTGAVSRYLVPDTATASITRLDRRLVYALDIPRAEYTECPLEGCPRPATGEPPRDRQPAQPSPARERDCTMRVASNNFNVKSTAQRRAINGFDTEQYNVDWSVVLEDNTKRRSTLQLTIDLWTTAQTPAIRDAMAMEASYARARGAALPERSAALPPEVITNMNRYFATSLSAADRAALLNLGRKMDKIKGHPILTDLKLFYKGNACGGAADEGAESGGGGGGGMANALSSLLGGGSGSGGSGGGAGGDRPLLAFTQEVKTWRVEPVRESQFAPPPQFKRSNPK